MGLFSAIAGLSTGMKIAGGVLGGSSILSSILGGKAAKQAAGAMTASREQQLAILQKQLEQQKKIYEEGKGWTEPYRDVGEWSLSELRERVAAGPGKFEEAPGYQFTLSEGLKQIQRMASAEHRGLGGRTLKDLTAYATGLASTEYDKFLARHYQSLQPFSSLATMGQTAVGQTMGLAQSVMGAGAETAGMMGQAAVGRGQAQAAGILGQHRAYMQPLQLAGNIAGMATGYGLLGKLTGGGGTLLSQATAAGTSPGLGGL